MNLTIPIRADNSTSNQSRLVRGNASERNSKVNRKRYVFSMITATLLVGTLIISSVGGMVHTASARDNFSSDSFTFDPNQNHSSADSQPATSRGSSTPKTVTPVAPTTPTMPATPAPVTPVVPATPVEAPVVPPVPPSEVSPALAPTSTVDPIPPSTPATTRNQPRPLGAQAAVTQRSIDQPTFPQPIDTSDAIATMTAAQAGKNPHSVFYSSGRLSDETRNRLLILAAVASVTGGLLYVMSVMSATAKVSKRQLISVPIREDTTQ